MPKLPNFRFPTSNKTALELLRLQADVVDRADGTDDVNESELLTEAHAEKLWRSASTPTVRELADAAAGRGNNLGHQVARTNAPTLMGALPKTVGWSEIQSAMKNAEAGGQLDETTVTGAMAGLGFVRQPDDEADAGCMVFERGKRTLGVRVAQLGAIRVAEVAVDGKKKGGREFPDLDRGDARTYVAGTLITRKLWEETVEEFAEVLGEARDALATASRFAGVDAPTLPVEFAALKAFIQLGASRADKAESAQEAAELQAVQSQITDLWAEMVTGGTAPKGVMLQFDGPDGAGKTSSSKYILKALMAANEKLPDHLHWELETEIFKAPTDEDKAWMKGDAGADAGIAKWQARHLMRGMPDARTVLFKDRFQPGDYVYVGEHTPERAEQMGREFEAYESHLLSEGVLPFKAILWADPKKQSKTFGKRMGRGAFADALISELKDRGTLTPEIEAQLTAVKNKVEAADMQAVTSFDGVLERYKEFAGNAGDVVEFPIIDATDRHAARLELMERFLGALQAHGDTQAGVGNGAE